VNLKVEDYFQTGKRSMIRFNEKGGKETEIPVHRLKILTSRIRNALEGCNPAPRRLDPRGTKRENDRFR
jgi:hypothetical protein